MIGIGKINLKKNLVGRDTFGLGILGESGYNHWRNGLEILIKSSEKEDTFNSCWGIIEVKIQGAYIKLIQVFVELKSSLNLLCL